MTITRPITIRNDYTIEMYSLDELKEGERKYGGLEDEEIAVLGGILGKLLQSGRRLGLRYIPNEAMGEITVIEYIKDRPSSLVKSNRDNCLYMLTDEQVKNLRDQAGTKQFQWEELKLIAALIRPEDRDKKFTLEELIQKLVSFMKDNDLNTLVPEEFHFTKHENKLEIIKE